MQWGAPQPETVRDYRLEVQGEAGWVVWHEETGNYQRRRVHQRATASLVSAVRLVVTATHGLDHARVCEVRVYG
jgi:hypothetical protein